jgi:hypothetical protein
LPRFRDGRFDEEEVDSALHLVETRNFDAHPVPETEASPAARAHQ